MGEVYRQLDGNERYRIARLREDGQSIRQVAAALDRPPSTISRELRRNSGAQVGYQPLYAHEQARARRWTGSRLERDAALRELVLYRFIYAQLRRTNDFAWRRYLPRAKSKRGWRGRRGGSPASFIRDRIPIQLRPEAAQTRQPGHWEADLMLFKSYAHAILVAHERGSRLLLIARQPNRAAQPAADQLIQWLQPLPDQLRQTITFDNGTEFAFHWQLNPLGILTFFCDPHSPWQKGGIENAIGRLRTPLPRKTNLDTIDPLLLTRAVATYNNTPRKCLDFLSPAEAFISQLLHFKCKSTSRPPPG